MIGKTKEFFAAFFRLEASSGLVLMIATALALILANSGLRELYDSVQPHKGFINNQLMVVFFLLIGMEIKRELVEGELSSLKQAMLSLVGAVGGMAVPALIYIVINNHADGHMRGWAIPSATDIAFSLGVLSLFGKRVPVSLKIFLMALAVLDDLGAIIIIALFYGGQINWQFFGTAFVVMAFLFKLGQWRVKHIAVYLLAGVLLYVCIEHSGIHGTIAGVLLGFMIPLNVKNKNGESLLGALVHNLHPFVAYGIMPLFAFANAGVSLAGISPSMLFAPVPFGIAAGLFIGKPLGIFGTSRIAVALGLAQQPEGANWKAFVGVGMLAGIGFTMSLFISMLALPDLQPEIKLGVLLGSALSAACGYVVLKLSL